MAGVFSNRERKPNPDTCFVMMPFTENFNAIYRLIQRCCIDQGLTCLRADEDVGPGKITGKIYDMVLKAGVIIVDMTGRNPNVFYELGLAHAISDNVVLLTQSPDDVPFDLRDFLHIRYTNTFDGAERLATELSKVLSTLLSSASLNIPLDDQRRSIPSVEPKDLSAAEFDLGLAHLQAEIARNSNDMQKAAEWLQKAIDYAKIGGGDAPEIGNCAIEAERCKFFDLAEGLYEIAISRDQTHVNNRQSYVSFLLDHRANNPKKIQLAGHILSELESVAERGERTRGLKAQYLSLTMAQKGSAQPADLEAAVADVVGDGNFDSLEQAAPAFLLLQRVRKYREMEKLADTFRKRLPTADVRVLDRILADAYASSDDKALEDEAIVIYERLLSEEDDATPDVKHNLATILFLRSPKTSNPRIFQLWSEAYGQRPKDSSIQKGFARYLVRHDRSGDAAKVLAGKPIH